MVPAHDAHVLCACGCGTRRACAGNPVAGARGDIAEVTGAGMGRRLVQARLLRRWNTLGSALGAECSIDSIAQSWAVISGAAEPGRCGGAPWAARTAAWSSRPPTIVLLFTPPFDHILHDPGWHQGVPARHSGKRRTVHPRRHVDGHRTGHPRKRNTGCRTVLPSSIRSATRAPVPTCSATRSSPMWWPRTSIR